VARRLAENPDVSVLLLLEAGGPDDVPEAMRSQQMAFEPGRRHTWSSVPSVHRRTRSGFPRYGGQMVALGYTDYLTFVVAPTVINVTVAGRNRFIVRALS
jgi:hypothetical protein